MSASTTTGTSSSSPYSTPAFWERLWRTAGIQSVGLFVIAGVMAHYGDRTWLLAAAVLGGMAVLNLMWFAAAIRSTLADAGKDGWGSAATASSAALGALLLLLIGLSAWGQSELAWAGFVASSFPRAMLIMAGTFGFWRAGLISNTGFAVGVGAVVLVLLAGTTWMSNGVWAPNGAYSQIVSPLIGIAWVVAATRVLLTRSPATRAGW